VSSHPKAGEATAKAATIIHHLRIFRSPPRLFYPTAR